MPGKVVTSTAAHSRISLPSALPKASQLASGTCTIARCKTSLMHALMAKPIGPCGPSTRSSSRSQASNSFSWLAESPR